MEPTCANYEELKKKWAPHIVQHDRWRGYAVGYRQRSVMKTLSKQREKCAR